ncbi:MAG TPA: hypothetical protein VFN80_00060, partial [Acidothermaceae bacterium]|nr:hypothetical protein [Acidothermaceae bacterium]
MTVTSAVPAVESTLTSVSVIDWPAVGRLVGDGVAVTVTVGVGEAFVGVGVGDGDVVGGTTITDGVALGDAEDDALAPAPAPAPLDGSVTSGLNGLRPAGAAYAAGTALGGDNVCADAELEAWDCVLVVVRAEVEWSLEPPR